VVSEGYWRNQLCKYNIKDVIVPNSFRKKIEGLLILSPLRFYGCKNEHPVFLWVIQSNPPLRLQTKGIPPWLISNDTDMPSLNIEQWEIMDSFDNPVQGLMEHLGFNQLQAETILLAFYTMNKKAHAIDDMEMWSMNNNPNDSPF
jgi:hypothetical protein